MDRLGGASIGFSFLCRHLSNCANVICRACMLTVVVWITGLPESQSEGKVPGRVEPAGAAGCPRHLRGHGGAGSGPVHALGGRGKVGRTQNSELCAQNSRSSKGFVLMPANLPRSV